MIDESSITACLSDKGWTFRGEYDFYDGGRFVAFLETVGYTVHQGRGAFCFDSFNPDAARKATECYNAIESAKLEIESLKFDVRVDKLHLSKKKVGLRCCYEKCGNIVVRSKKWYEQGEGQCTAHYCSRECSSNARIGSRVDYGF